MFSRLQQELPDARNLTEAQRNNLTFDSFFAIISLTVQEDIIQTNTNMELNITDKYLEPLQILIRDH